jgi:hypothetical protein
MGQLEGIEVGRDHEKRAWGAAGHGKTCITIPKPPRKLRNCGTQHPRKLNEETSSKSHHIQLKTPTCETSSQTSLITTNLISTQTLYPIAIASSQIASNKITPIPESIISPFCNRSIGLMMPIYYQFYLQPPFPTISPVSIPKTQGHFPLSVNVITVNIIFLEKHLIPIYFTHLHTKKHFKLQQHILLFQHC